MSHIATATVYSRKGHESCWAERRTRPLLMSEVDSKLGDGMKRFWQIAAVAGAALLLISLTVAPILVYELGIPWLPPVPRASDSQLALVYVIDAPLIAATGWLLRTFWKYLSGAQKSKLGLTIPTPQSPHAQWPQAKQTSYDDPIVIDAGREREVGLMGCGEVCVGMILALIGIGTFNHVHPLSLSDNGGSMAFIAWGLLVIGTAFVGESGGYLKIGSDGIHHSAGRLFIPWDEMSRVYITGSTSSPEYLSVELKERSRLHFLEPIKSRYAKGAISI